MADATQGAGTYRPRIATATGWTILLMVLLRIAIGWHFLYEGIWKLKSGTFSATPYLLASSGPLRGVFLKMVDDPFGLERVQKQPLYDRIDERYEAIVEHFKLNQEQKTELAVFRERKKHGIQDKDYFAAVLADPTFQKELEDHRRVVVASRPADRTQILGRFLVEFQELDEAIKKLCTPEQLAKAGNPLSLIPIMPATTVANADNLEWLTQEYLNRVIDERYEKLKQHYQLTAKQDLKGKMYRDQKKTGPADKINVDDILADPDLEKQRADYAALLKQIEEEEHSTDPKFKSERLAFDYKKLDKLRGALLARAEAPVMDMDPARIAISCPDAKNILTCPDVDFRLTTEQLTAGPLPSPDARRLVARQLTDWGHRAGIDLKFSPRTRTFWLDLSMMFGLCAIGACLILGLFTRLAACGAVVMLAMFYLSMPPWLGVPEPPVSEGHYLWVNKNLIELIACLMLASSHVGRWFGLDAFFGAISTGRKRRQALRHEAMVAVQATPLDRLYAPEMRPPVRDTQRV